MLGMQNVQNAFSFRNCWAINISSAGGEEKGRKKSVEFPCSGWLRQRLLVLFIRILDTHSEHVLSVSSDTEDRGGWVCLWVFLVWQTQNVLHATSGQASQITSISQPGCHKRKLNLLIHSVLGKKKIEVCTSLCNYSGLVSVGSHRNDQFSKRQIFHMLKLTFHWRNFIMGWSFPAAWGGKRFPLFRSYGSSPALKAGWRMWVPYK